MESFISAFEFDNMPALGIRVRRGVCRAVPWEAVSCHFRVEKGSAYIPIAEGLSSVEPPKQSEQKLTILSEELRPEAADVPAPMPEKGDTKAPNQ